MPSNDIPERMLVDSRAAAQLPCVSQRTLWSLKESGRLSFVAIGRLIRFDVRDLEAFVSESKRKAGD